MSYTCLISLYTHPTIATGTYNYHNRLAAVGQFDEDLIKGPGHWNLDNIVKNNIVKSFSHLISSLPSTFKKCVCVCVLGGGGGGGEFVCLFIFLFIILEEGGGRGVKLILVSPQVIVTYCDFL